MLNAQQQNGLSLTCGALQHCVRNVNTSNETTKDMVEIWKDNMLIKSKITHQGPPEPIKQKPVATIKDLEASYNYI